MKNENSIILNVQTNLQNFIYVKRLKTIFFVEVFILQKTDFI